MILKYYDTLESIGMREEDFMDDLELHGEEAGADLDGSHAIFWPFSLDDDYKED